MQFRFSYINLISFWIGFAAAILFWWIIGAMRPLFRQVRQNWRTKRETAKVSSTSKVEENYRQLVLRQAQGLHLAAPLFSLDEIVLPPLLLASPPRVEPGGPPFAEDIVTSTIPYLPAWPELAAIYNAHTLTLAEALSGNSDIVLAGQPGAGKTVTLAYLASRLARRDPVPGLPEDMLPFLVHVADLSLPLNKKDEPLTLLTDIIPESTPVFGLPRIPSFVRRAFVDGRALLLLDGTDELPPAALQDVIEFIRAIKRTYPNTRIVTTAFPEYLDGLVTLNFVPFTLAAWTAKQRAEFLEKWGDLWTRFVAVEAWAQTGPGQVDSLLLNHWISANNNNLTPLELTLKVWGAYAGDTHGPRAVDDIETHVRRLTPPDTLPAALELLALQANLATEPIFDPRKAREWIKSYEPPENALENAETEKGKKSKGEKQSATTLSNLTKMAASGLLANHRNSRIRFVHPVFGGYLAGKALVNYKHDALLEQPACSGKFLALHYLAAHGDATLLAEACLNMPDRPLERNLLTAARWLRDAPGNAPWRSKVMARLAELLQDEGLPLGLRGQAVAAFVLSDDPSATVLFRQMLQSHAPELLQLSALGSGAMQDTKAIEELSALFRNPSPNVHRAACLALVAIGTTTALESVASALLHGDDDLRRTAAEALANHPTEGHAMLRDAAAMEDIPVRRAAVYGLGRIAQPWADELLVKLQVEDNQWIVRNAATEVLDRKQQHNQHIPQRLPPPSESPWLIEFAGKQGLGVSPDKPATDLLLAALRSGTEEEQLAALSYLRMMPSEGVFGVLYQAMYGGNLELREAVFRTFWEMAARGVNVPDPQKFGVG